MGRDHTVRATRRERLLSGAGADPLLSALRIVLLYAVVAGLWIYFSDTLLGALARDAPTFMRYSVLKGFLFIAVTATLLYVLIARRIHIVQGISRALARSDARFRLYVESSPIALIVFDAEGCCVDCNRAALQLIGREADQAHGRRREEILPRTDLPRDGAAALGMDFETRRPDGTRLWVNVRAVQLDRDRSLWFCQDVSERVSAQAAIREARERLIQAEKMEAVGRLAGGVAHDFNNILTAIFGYSDILAEALPAEGQARAFVSEIRKAAARAVALTQQLLAFSRRQALVPQLVNLNELIGGLKPMLERLIGEDVEILLDLDKDVWTVRADPARLEQALVNLAVNARDAMPRGGRLTLATRNVPRGTRPEAAPDESGDRDCAALTVSDTGVGMDAETRTHLFEPFFTTKEVGKGTGLGLATVYGIVKQSGGSITFETQEGQGTSFTLSLPRIEREEPTWVPPSAGSTSDVDGRELILYVEDDEAVRTLVTHVLTKHGYEVLAARDGHEALRLAAPVMQRLALVITDVVMPRMNGRDLAEQLHRLRGDLKVVFISGYTRDIVERNDIAEAGAVLIEKPIEPLPFLKKVRSVLDS